MKLLRNIGLYVGHLLTALIGTAIFVTAIVKLHRPTSVLAVLRREVVAGFICAAILGFIASKIAKNSVGVWVWAAIAPFFVFHALSTVFVGSQTSVLGAPRSLWAAIFGFDCLDARYAGQCRNFFALTVPMVRTVAYSLGACLGVHLLVFDTEGNTGPLPNSTGL